MDLSLNAQQEWFATALGQRFLRDEQAIVAERLDTVFGEHLVQIGQWHSPDTFLSYARTQKKTLIDWRDGASADVVMRPSHLAIASDSVDAVLLPHTLELVASPHSVLREAERILRADGHIIIMSFEAGGLWGLRHLLSPRGYPVAPIRPIREGRLRDWLELLSFAVGPAHRYCHTMPITRFAYFGRAPEESWSSRWLPLLHGGHCIAAQKRVLPLTTVRGSWRKSRLRVVGGLVEPSANSAPRSKAP